MCSVKALEFTGNDGWRYLSRDTITTTTVIPVKLHINLGDRVLKYKLCAASTGKQNTELDYQPQGQLGKLAIVKDSKTDDR